MEEFKVLITTSGIGSRLGNLTKYTNKSLIRVGKKPTLSYIIESYPEDTEIVITLGYFGDYVKQFVELAYPKRKITFVEVDKYYGDGSSLAYSLLKAKEHLQCKFIFHSSDTIVSKDSFDFSDEKFKSDWLGICEKENCSEYRTIGKNGFIYDKGSLVSNLAYIGLAGISSYELFWKNLEDIYNENPLDSSLSDCHAINRMNVNWNNIIFPEWLDTGNSFELKKSREIISDKFHLLDKDDESIFIFEDFVIKFFNNENICANRVARALELKDVTPSIISSSKNFYKYEYAKGELLASCVNTSIFSDFLKWSKNNLWKSKGVDQDFKKICYDFYFDKTQKRVSTFQSNNKIFDKKLIINGREIPSLKSILESIDIDWLCGDSMFRFHGDFILDNIIYNNGEFILLDWRQDFGGSILNGDIYYDLAKLNHNLILNHDILFKELFHVNVRDNVIECDILRSERLINCKEFFNEWVISNGFDLKKINVLTAIIWLNMSPLHEFKMGEFLYYFGIYNLHKSLFLCNRNCL